MGRETTSIKDLKGWNGPRDDGKQFRQPQTGVHCYCASSGLVRLSAFCPDLKMVSYLSIQVLHRQEDHHCRAETIPRPLPRAWTTTPTGETSLLSLSKVVGPISIPLIFLTHTIQTLLLSHFGVCEPLVRSPVPFINQTLVRGINVFWTNAELLLQWRALAGNSAWREWSITGVERRGQSTDRKSPWTEQPEDGDSVLFVSLAPEPRRCSALTNRLLNWTDSCKKWKEQSRAQGWKETRKIRVWGY